MSDNDFNLQDYLENGVEILLKDAMKASFRNPKESLFLVRFSKNARKANKIRQRYSENGQNIPVFLIASITSSCNLHCTGCYSRANDACSDDAPLNQLSADEWEDIFNQAKEIGISFIVLAGGEPMLREDVIIKASNIPEILFPIFTNGTMMSEDYLKLFDENRNLVPIFSIEGNEEITDLRRGKGVYRQLLDSMDLMRKNNLIFGASLTFTKENLDNLLSNEYINQLHDLGCKVIFFIEYVPVNEATVELAPGDSERELLLNEINRLRQDFSDMIFMSFPGDEKTSGGCLAAGRGFFHINSHGGAEPCPASPYSDINVADTSLIDALNSRLFKSLRDGDLLIDDHAGGCVLFENKEKVEELLKQK
ncbi:MAG: radical SAM protein [Methanobrevibacter sp.]|uniref:radical SAM/SPASM domain-containing protein n=1 Tax=Methanobrevibacter sp. TaxID=66852 RepID=UPI002600B5BD|nr:radical SAM protein [Methanobrevibacter sp.]MBE6507838.1 radical SAM protein [Methanobrevibacter sp.]